MSECVEKSIVYDRRGWPLSTEIRDRKIRSASITFVNIPTNVAGWLVESA